jgi:hypothetical protein
MQEITEGSNAKQDRNEDAELRQLAEELCPLADRFGRVLTDLSPLLRVLALSLAPTPSDAATSATHGTQMAPSVPLDYFPVIEHPANSILEMSLASLLRPR